MPRLGPVGQNGQCSICWKSDTIVYVAWGTTISVLEITADITGSGVSTLHRFDTLAGICGIAPFKDCIIVLTRHQDSPQKACLTVLDFVGQVVETDVLPLEITPTDTLELYSLQPAQNTTTYYVSSPHGILVARARDLADRVAWLVAQEQYGQAIDAVARSAGKAIIPIEQVSLMGRNHISQLLTRGEKLNAARECRRIYGQDTQAWQNGIEVFIEHDAIKELLAYIPTNEPRLSVAAYDRVLTSCISDLKVYPNLSRMCFFCAKSGLLKCILLKPF